MNLMLCYGWICNETNNTFPPNNTELEANAVKLVKRCKFGNLGSESSKWAQQKVSLFQKSANFQPLCLLNLAFLITL